MFAKRKEHDSRSKNLEFNLYENINGGWWNNLGCVVMGQEPMIYEAIIRGALLPND